MGLWSFFVMDQFSWSRVKPFVKAVSRQVPNLSHLLTKLSPPFGNFLSLSYFVIWPPSTFPAANPHLPPGALDTFSFLFLKLPSSLPPQGLCTFSLPGTPLPQ